MKKILFLIVLFTAFLAAHTEESKWLYDVNLGASFPFYKAEIDESLYGFSFTGNGFSVDVREAIIHKKSGFTLKFSLGWGAYKINDFFSDNAQTGFSFNTLAGLGYSYVKNQRFVLSLCGITGIDMSFIRDEFDLSSNERLIFELSEMPVIVILGVDFTATLRITKRFGIYASMLAASPVGGIISERVVIDDGNQIGTQRESISIKAFNGYLLKPSLGLSIIFD